MNVITILILFLISSSSFVKSSPSNLGCTQNVRQRNFTTSQDARLNLNQIYWNATVIRRILHSTLSPRMKSNNRWQVGRVTKKQYGIINLLWQKTKIFIDLDDSNMTCKATTSEVTSESNRNMYNIKLTPQTPISKALQFSTRREQLKVTTPSFIEFYYHDESDERIKRNQSSDFVTDTIRNNKISYANKTLNPKKSVSIKPSLFKINAKSMPLKQPTPLSQRKKSGRKTAQGETDWRSPLNKMKTKFGNATSELKSKLRNGAPSKSLHSSLKEPVNNTKIKPLRNKDGFTLYLNSNEILNSSSYINKRTLIPLKTTTDYDKVKFFEIYDSNTPKYYNFKSNNANSTFENESDDRNFNDDEQILLQHVSQNTGHNNDNNITRFVKKHSKNSSVKEEKTRNKITVSNPFKKQLSELKNASKTFESFPFQKHSIRSKPAAWSEFPFVAAYIYEPSQVRCDAAILSPHWLMAAASCLSRHRRELRGGSLSAFVTYCSDDWRYSRRISYVKRTLIHPQFHPREIPRRYLFNLGIIQVVNSMADTCNIWSPVSLMSHQFTADQGGSTATAVGWGLDRYDMRYDTTEIPSHNLMIYENLVHSQTCPGNIEYSKAKRLEEDGIGNAYCLSLPPYLAEENDTVHGALLLIGGKLLALYLQEERRSWGPQSAMYTAVWRLVPWLSGTAREPEDSFQFEV